MISGLDNSLDLRRGGFRQVMQEASSELTWLDPCFKFPDSSVENGNYNGLNLRSIVDVRCANLAGWISGSLVEWTGNHLSRFKVDISKGEIGQLISPGIMTIAETHATIPLLDLDTESSEWFKIANTSNEFTSGFANGGTAVLYAVRRWLSLRRSLTNYFEYDPDKLAVYNNKLSFTDKYNKPAEAAKTAAKFSGSKTNFCVALQAVIGHDDEGPITLYDGVSHAFSRGAKSLIYPRITADEIILRRNKCDAIRRQVLVGDDIEGQMQAAITEMS